MTHTPVLPTDGAGFVPASEDVESVLAWFADYDAAAGAGEIQRMADMALFPINVISTDAEGNASAASWTREVFVERWTEILGGGHDIEMKSVRTPHFVSRELVFVTTDSTFTVEGHTQTVRYGDLLVRVGGRWLFQTMVQGGWGQQ
ncbi:nuclear transport factor 2 family protein [Crossiella sp. SN42]|uniref:nuclear transport factor 2 family protein n=1 Tax=Crossiella sp. SN42 TaxID=2944808 RepID=UPI00207C5952|nr:nuclear transport factor 2 family protein [Crossiella sp. SN42]MCO1578652.1 nuclear transport factor 2 family protein [Crossiella sp. SN42]